MTVAKSGLSSVVLAVAAAAFLATLGGAPPAARASVPLGAPAFSAPTIFTNPLFPFVPGGARIFTGRSGKSPTAILDSFLADTRDLPWNGGTVTCRVLVEANFEDGVLVESTRNYFAQADDGSVWYFGETVDTFEDGVPSGHGGSWLVGGGNGGDPAETIAATNPSLFMPAAPEAGDEYMPEDVPAGPMEIDRVRRTGVRVRTAAGRFRDCIQVLEHDLVDDDFETKWYAPGIGVLKGKARGETFSLVATTWFTPAE